MRRACVVSLLALCSFGCGEPCESTPALRLNVSSATPVDTLEVQLRIGGDTFFRTFDAASATTDNQTSLEVALDVEGLVAGQDLGIVVQGLAATELVGTASASTDYQPEACLEVSVDLSRGRCGDGRLDPGEQCDGIQVGEIGCLSRGQRQGNGGVSCNNDCEVELNCTGGDINSIDQIEGALSDIRGGLTDRVLAIRPGSYAVPDPIVVDVPGLTITSLEGAVEFGGDVAFVVSADGVTISNLEFTDVLTAVHIRADSVVFSGNRLTSPQRAAQRWILVEGDGARVLSNHISGDAAVGVDVQGAADVTVALNVMQGALTSAVRSADASGFQQYDHNTVELSAGVGFQLATASPQTDFCLRNNLLQLAASTTGYDVAQMVRFRSCGGVDSGDNGVFGMGTECAGRCNDCRNGGPLCTHTGDADLDAEACLGPLSPAIDVGRDAGWDLLPNAAALFGGASPDLGALESGGAWRFGGSELSCP